MKRFIALLVAALLLGSCALPAGETSSEESPYHAGEYRGSAKGYTGELEVSVTLTDSHIDEIRVPRCPETEGIGAVVVEQLPGLIVANQTFEVDVVAGATVTSRALLEAVREAVSASGADLTPLLEKPAEPVSPSLRAEVTEADLIVVGAGGAGLTAALAAAQADPELRIVLLEKTASPGGNTLFALDGSNAASTAAQQEAGIEDGFEQMLADSLATADTQEGTELLETLVGDSAGALDWLAEAGFPLDKLGELPGSSVERTHLPESGDAVGEYLVKGLTASVQSAGVSTHYHTRATGLLTDEEGRIKGVIAESPGVRRLFTGRAVILATGGFAANDKLCGSYRTLLRGLDTVSAAAAQGDGIMMAQELGAATVDMGQIVTEPTVHRGSGIVVPRALREEGAILVNRSGERLTAEQEDDQSLSELLLAQPGRCGWLLFGEGLLRLLPDSLQARAASGADLEKLARATGIPEQALGETVAARNAELPELLDADGNEPHPARLEGTLYALEVSPGVKSTLGGLKITVDAEVLGADGLPIPGLYAAGEVTGGIHGAAALPGNQLTELLVFGRRAGGEAAGYLRELDEEAESDEDV